MSSQSIYVSLSILSLIALAGAVRGGRGLRCTRAPLTTAQGVAVGSGVAMMSLYEPPAAAAAAAPAKSDKKAAAHSVAERYVSRLLRHARLTLFPGDWCSLADSPLSSRRATAEKTVLHTIYLPSVSSCGDVVVR